MWPARQIRDGDRASGRRQCARPVQQVGVGRQVGEAQQRRAGLARAQEFAGAADLQVAPRDLEAVGGLAPSPSAGRAPSRRAGRCRRRDTAARRPTPPRRGPRARATGAAATGRSAPRARSPSAMRWARRRPTSITVVDTSTPIWPAVKGDITAFFSAGGMRECSRPTMHARQRVAQAPRAWRWRWCRSSASLSSISGQTQYTCRPCATCAADALDHLVAPAVGDQLGDDGRAAGRQFVDGGDIQVGVIAHGQRARDRRGGHHQQVRLGSPASLPGSSCRAAPAAARRRSGAARR